MKLQQTKHINTNVVVKPKPLVGLSSHLPNL
jgi:hypothetical protein